MATIPEINQSAEGKYLKVADGKPVWSDAILPDGYHDTRGVTAGAADVLAGEKIVDAQGREVEGTIQNRGNLDVNIDGVQTTKYQFTAGYYPNGGTVSLDGTVGSASEAIAEAIRGKRISVPVGTKLTGLAALVESIPVVVDVTIEKI